MTTKPYMVYFGPYKESGHFFYDETGWRLMRDEVQKLPWQHELDGTLQPGQVLWRGEWVQRGPRIEGEALLHHKDGWTALSMWDSSVDTRPGCNSTYIAQGIFTFDEMVALAKERFAERWNRMKFPVVPAKKVE